jgi:hypothetical protein
MVVGSPAYDTTRRSIASIKNPLRGSGLKESVALAGKLSNLIWADFVVFNNVVGTY